MSVAESNSVIIQPLDNPGDNAILILSDSSDEKNNDENKIDNELDGENEVDILEDMMTENIELAQEYVAKQQQKTDRDDMNDEIQVTRSNVTNPLISYPHMRHLCGVHQFSPGSNENNTYCDNCYCYVCDKPAKNCLSWNNDHCHATDEENKWVKKRKERVIQRRNIDMKKKNVSVIDLMSDSSENSDGLVGSLASKRKSRFDEPATRLNKIRRRGQELDLYSKANEYIGTKPRSKARITEVLLHNLRSNSKSKTIHRLNEEGEIEQIKNSPNIKMDGDFPRLNLQKSFFVEGVRIGWPYPCIMPPQRQMALHLIKAFKNKRHVVLESPTGTGKSAAILCTTLAWQRYNKKIKIIDGEEEDDEKETKIYYCCRTHSQVTQMVESLKKTPYRPRMTILGSRDRMCIHKNIRPKNNRGMDGDNINSRQTSTNLSCQQRVRNTEKFRKKKLNQSDYDDDRPIQKLNGDNDDDRSNISDDDDNDDEAKNNKNKKVEKTCPHYRQLTKRSLADRIYNMHMPTKSEEKNSSNQSLGCSPLFGGEKTKFGVHDIEDLVAFGNNPSVMRGISIYRSCQCENSSEETKNVSGEATITNATSNNKSFGIKLSQQQNGGPIVVDSVRPGEPADAEGSIREGDTIVRINEHDVTKRSGSIRNITQKIREIKDEDPLVVDVFRGGDQYLKDGNFDEETAACPYYISRALEKDAEIVFAPHNYILDSGIRNAMNIDLKNAIVVLDEAHNVESALRDMASVKYNDFELMNMVIMLDTYSSKRNDPNDFSQYSFQNRKDLSSTAHELLLFVEDIMFFLGESLSRFEKNQVPNGIINVTREYEKFKYPDDKEFEVSYFGPTGFGVKGKAIGCKPFFDKINFDSNRAVTLLSCIEEFENAVSGVSRESEDDDYNIESNINNDDSQQRFHSVVLDGLVKLVVSFCDAFKSSEHFYISSSISANGNLDFATTGDDMRSDTQRNRYRKKPQANPHYPTPTQLNPNPQRFECRHCANNKKNHTLGGKGNLYHAEYCDGKVPRWRVSINLNLLSPGLKMDELSSSCRSIVLASGSLAPIGSLCAELNLFPPAVNVKVNGGENCSPLVTIKNENQLKPDFGTIKKDNGRLQTTPRPLQANHVVNLSKQLLAVSIGNFTDGSPLSVKMANYKQFRFYEKLGDSIATIIENIPKGGVLVFFSSFSFLRKCVNVWQDQEVWIRLHRAKGKVVLECTGSADSSFESLRDTYQDTIRSTGNCILFAVFRGKMSEGISFNDDFARCVICVGIPYPSSFERSIKAKKDYNNEQRKLRQSNILPGAEWYAQQAYRAIAQALGRCIRHVADYGSIILLDSRYCDDAFQYNNISGICSAHSRLPKWMNHSIRNLRWQTQTAGKKNDIFGGWNGLKIEFEKFYREARIHVSGVRRQQALAENKVKQDRARYLDTLTFNNGKWYQQKGASKVKTEKSNEGAITPNTGLGVTSIPPVIQLEDDRSRADGANVTEKNESGDSTATINTDKCKKISSIDQTMDLVEKDIPPDKLEIDVLPRNGSLEEPHLLGEKCTTSTMTIPKLQPPAHATTHSSITPSQEVHLCLICEENPKNVVLLPCKHLCLCSSCYKGKNVNDCPLCRERITDSMEVFT